MNIDFKTKPDGLNAKQVLLFNNKEANIIGNGYMNKQVDIFIIYDSSGELLNTIVQKKEGGL